MYESVRPHRGRAPSLIEHTVHGHVDSGVTYSILYE